MEFKPRKFLYTLRGNSSEEDIQRLRSQYNCEISRLRDKLTKVQNENEALQQSLSSTNEEINSLRNGIKVLKQDMSEQTDALTKERAANNDLRHNNMTLQDKNEQLVGRSGNVVSKLIRFCELLKTMEFSSADECIAAIKSEIEKSSSDLGLNIVDTYEGEFNSKFHRIVDTKITDDVFQKDHIAEVVRPGIWYAERCLIPQDVIIYTVNK